MSTDPKVILAEFGIDLKGNDPAGRYQRTLRGLSIGSDERKRLEQAWNAYMLGHHERARSEPTNQHSASSQDQPHHPHQQPNTPVEQKAAPAPSALGWVQKRALAIGLVVAGAVIVLLLIGNSGQEPADRVNAQVQVDSLANALKVAKAEADHAQKLLDQNEAAKAAQPIPVADTAAIIRAHEEKTKAVATSKWKDGFDKLQAELQGKVGTAHHHEQFEVLERLAKDAIDAGEAQALRELLEQEIEKEEHGGQKKAFRKLANGHAAQWNRIIGALRSKNADALVEGHDSDH